ncbi:MAG: HAMP domain-containing protein [Magnetococcales bacterium]|nr:HAMP domain-containing protein [Magnetococcales bacterium]
MKIYFFSLIYKYISYVHRFPLPRKIGFRLLLFIVMFSGLITLSGSALQLYLDFRNDIEQIEEQLSFIERSQLGGVIRSIWNVDNAQLDVQLQGISNLPDIAHVHLTLDDGTVRAVGSHHMDGKRKISRSFRLTHEHLGKTVYLGILQVEGNLERIYARTTNRLIVILSTQGVRTFLVSLFILLIFQRMVTRHLGSLSESIARLDKGDLDTPLHLKRRNAPHLNEDELGELVRAFNTMRINLKHSKEELRGHKQTLEKTVAHRTSELQKSNQELSKEIAKRSRMESDLRASLQEKEILLKEINHRVKNNLQVISSLIRMQTRTLGEQADETISSIFKSSQNRIQAMALVHKELYDSENLSHVDLRSYIRQLTHHLQISFGLNKSRISLQINGDDVQLDLSKSMPIGLVIQELVSNALQHAFPAEKKGNIIIEMKQIDDIGTILLTVEDDGVGLPVSIDPSSPPDRSLGLQLVKTLVTHQLNGSMQFDDDYIGVRCRIKIPNGS